MTTTTSRARTQSGRVTAADMLAARAALPLSSGRLAGTMRLHRFVPAGGTVTQCRECWGWRDDVRHPVTDLPVAG
ncbi:hypothetical protein AB0K20_23255 [Micromonospora matsumotoense]|uniref:hypothetical protein n=1 Tax=Micromonospora matsumotoense TaxID=121616 RepID=UPI00342F9524